MSMMLYQLQLGEPKPGDKVEMYIDSPGGEAEIGLAFADKIRDLIKIGVHFKCVANDAISAAFMIWASCNERLVLPYGTILFHYPYLPYIQGQLRSKEFETEAASAKVVEALWKQRWNSYLFGFVSEANQDKAAAEETQFFGRQFCLQFAPGFCKVVYVYKFLEEKKL
jgi:ATP-dependent protease ClpP protease subunit